MCATVSLCLCATQCGRNHRSVYRQPTWIWTCQPTTSPLHDMNCSSSVLESSRLHSLVLMMVSARHAALLWIMWHVRMKCPLICPNLFCTCLNNPVFSAVLLSCSLPKYHSAESDSAAAWSDISVHYTISCEWCAITNQWSDHCHHQ